MKSRQLLNALVGCLAAGVLLMVYSCARMGSPDGGWYDETPPHVIGAEPADQATNVNKRKIYINFDEFIKIDNPTPSATTTRAIPSATIPTASPPATISTPCRCRATSYRRRTSNR